MSKENLETLDDACLVRKVKDSNSSDALKILVERHTGIYTKIVTSLTKPDNNQTEDFLNEKFYCFYRAAQKYDESKNMKFSTFLGQTIKFDCMRENYKNKDKAPIFSIDEMLSTFQNAPETKKQLTQEEIFEKDRRFENVISKAKEINELFGKLLEERLSSSNERPLSIKEASQKIGISEHKAYSIYNKNLKKLKEHVCFKYTN